MRYPVYRYRVNDLYTGSSLGNYLTFACLSRESDVKGLWSALDDHFYVGDWTIDFKASGKPLLPAETVFNPESQTTVYRADDIIIEKQVFVPFSRVERELAPPSFLQSCVFQLRCSNASVRPAEILIHHEIYFPAKPNERFTKQPPAKETEKAVEIVLIDDSCEVMTVGAPDEVRVFGASAGWTRCQKDKNRLVTDFHLRLEGGEEQEMRFIVSYSNRGREDARQIFDSIQANTTLLLETVAAYKGILDTTEIMTPEPVINRGLQWAKINTVRVQHRYRTGYGFTNDPPQDIIVVRDAAWYILGSDYLTPEFSKGLIDLVAKFAYHDDGKLTEFIRASECVPEKHDYNLNINDDTPLFIHALHHHALAAGGESLLANLYPLMRRAADYILSQVKEGLVRCYSDGTYVWGICSWRNIIDGYNLTGAVTEINAECYHALTVTADAAHRLGRKEESKKYQAAAEHLKSEINSRLLSQRTGLYVLNLDNQERPHDDITGDLIFPVMFGTADKPLRKRILEKLTDDDMWMPPGARTVSRFEPNYDPDFGYQLMGGLWPNLTAWTAFCVRKDDPQKLVEAMVNTYKYCEPERPVNFVNVVPGEFPERIHGESLISRGMAMSPWMPPTYLWLGVEGLLGALPGWDELELDPCIPPDWKWIAVKNLLWCGKRITAFVHDGVLYSTHTVKSSMPVRVGEFVESSSEPCSIITIGMKIEDEYLLFAASDVAIEGTVRIDGESQSAPQKVSLPPGGSLLLRLPVDS